MTTKLDGTLYQNFIDYGIRNLSLYCDRVNELNVFPVPDGDTGTNMVKTLQNGFHAINGLTGDLPDLSRKFAKAVVFGARGNSGVITSQFFKGFSETLYSVEEADCTALAEALQAGVDCAYKAVAHPVEGTILTVLRQAAERVSKDVADRKVSNVDELLSSFLKQARLTLEETPDLLPILKSAGVVDSGGAGIVYVFEGMEKYLKNEPIALSESATETAEAVDFSRFDKNSSFEYGYCTEFLLQLTCGAESLNTEEFRRQISALGDSVVTVFEEDKIKVHVHTKTPEAVLEYAHAFGEFLTLKIENMSVQHSQTLPALEICGEGGGEFAVVAVTHNPVMRDMFRNMGADVVLAGDKNTQPSTKDFLKAYQRAGAKEIFVFPNSKNSNLAALQAGEFLEESNVTVFDTKSVAECYAALSMMDFEAEDKSALAEEIREIIQNVYTVLITQASKNSTFNGTQIEKDDFLAVSGAELLGVAKERIAVAVRTLETVLRESDRDTVTLFAGESVPSEELDSISAYVEKHHPLTDLDVIATGSDVFDLLISFE